MSKFDEELGKVFQDARINKTLTQQDVADRLGVSRSCYSYYELGKRELGFATVQKLCNILDLDINDVTKQVKKYLYRK